MYVFAFEEEKDQHTLLKIHRQYKSDAVLYKLHMFLIN